MADTNNISPAMFGKTNYIWMLAGVLAIAIGMFLMAGGKSDSPAVFDKNQVYSTTRITVAPIVILIGLAVVGLSIFKKNPEEKNNREAKKNI